MTRAAERRLLRSGAGLDARTGFGAVVLAELVRLDTMQPVLQQALPGAS